MFLFWRSGEDARRQQPLKKARDRPIVVYLFIWEIPSLILNDVPAASLRLRSFFSPAAFVPFDWARKRHDQMAAFSPAAGIASTPFWVDHRQHLRRVLFFSDLFLSFVYSYLFFLSVSSSRAFESRKRFPLDGHVVASRSIVSFSSFAANESQLCWILPSLSGRVGKRRRRRKKERKKEKKGLWRVYLAR